jgi:hypothetical protein
MTEQTTELSDEQRAELAQREREAKLWVKVQREENDRAQVDQDWKELGRKNSAEGRDFVRRQCGFDPGW